jgi:hypothetical protein
MWATSWWDSAGGIRLVAAAGIGRLESVMGPVGGSGA